jgi:hypothetical protein
MLDFSIIDGRVKGNPRYEEHATPEEYENETNWEGNLVGLFEFEK